MEDVYELFRRGMDLLDGGHHHQALIPLRRARELSPEHTSIREALGRALFHTQRYGEAAEEFEAIVDRAPTNDYALFCLGRSAATGTPSGGLPVVGTGRLYAACPT
jgi:tetratricopeptide (TPR) repeat protein